MGCRLRRTCDWAVRSVHESMVTKHEYGTLAGAPRSCFVTLTYNDEHLPTHPANRCFAPLPHASGPYVHMRDFQLFMKRLRKMVHQLGLIRSDETIRYLHSGEYGEINGRPHFHALLFGIDWTGFRIPRSKSGRNVLYTSPLLDKVWRCTRCKGSLGYATFGNVSFQSAAYTARYAIKKLHGDKAVEQYPTVVDTDTGEVQALAPYSTMSKKPGLGRKFFEQYVDQIYTHDNIKLEGSDGKWKTFPVPRRYDKWLAKEDVHRWENVKDKRAEQAKARADKDPRELDEILAVKEAIKTQAIANADAERAWI